MDRLTNSGISPVALSLILDFGAGCCSEVGLGVLSCRFTACGCEAIGVVQNGNRQAACDKDLDHPPLLILVGQFPHRHVTHPRTQPRDHINVNGGIATNDPVSHQSRPHDADLGLETSGGATPSDGSMRHAIRGGHRSAVVGLKQCVDEETGIVVRNRR